MGRRKKFGEESGFVNVRVPKSKVSEYRDAIKKLVDEKFTRDTDKLREKEGDKGNLGKERVVFRDFREFGKKVEDKGDNNTDDEDDFIAEIFKEVDKHVKGRKDNE
ncbi:MAG: hypothetical protein HWN79_04200 [Candidatus Lokiarchaeota archaeon]|nr:hypothetical protein [Candidatus Lokiarchaeota archaeon]